MTLLGDNADGIMLTYNLSVIDSLNAVQDAEVIGSALLEE